MSDEERSVNEEAPEEEEEKKDEEGKHGKQANSTKLSLKIAS